MDRVSSQLKILWSLYTNNEQVEPEVKLQGPLTLAPKKKEIGTNLTKRVQDLDEENYETLISEIKELNKWRDIQCS